MYHYIVTEFKDNSKTEVVKKTKLASMQHVADFLGLPKSTIGAFVTGKKSNTKLKNYTIKHYAPHMTPHRMKQICKQLNETQGTNERMAVLNVILEDYVNTLQILEDVE
tara:strand:+ start:60 stop:386 length:327 start_codon:yes stop_codon:yes gene_type:complete